jgi:hypothetical protein
MRAGMLDAVSGGMKRFSILLGVVVLSLSGLLGGCAMGRHGHLAWIAPPLIAAAIVTSRPGFVWVEGHWDWAGGRWSWTNGYWMREQPGFVWEQGIWIHNHDRYEWRPGRWHSPRVEVRDHRR